MKTILLLAGRSTRFWPLTDKTLFPLCGKTLVEHQVERLAAGGCADLTIVAGAHNIDALRLLFPHLTIVQQRNLDLGMQGALLDVLPTMKEEPVLIVSGNDVIDPSAYRMLVSAMENNSCDGALLAAQVKRYFPGGYLTLDGMRITGILEKPGEGNEPSDCVNIVAHVHRSPKILLAALQSAKAKSDDGYEQALSALFPKHYYVAVRYDGTWLPVKYPWHILPLLELLVQELPAQSIHPSATVHPSAVITGTVVLEEGVKVLPHATIVGPCFVGAHSIIANNALVRGSSIGRHCVVGFGSEVKSSALAAHVWTHSTYIGDSVIGSNVSFGAGSVTGNLRLDEGEIHSAIGKNSLPTGLQKFGAIIGEDCRLGIHTGLNPGVKIGKGSFVSSGCLLNADLPDASFASMKEGVLVVRPNSAKPPSPDDRTKFRTIIR